MSKAKPKKKPNTRGFIRGQGYWSCYSGNFYTFLGVDGDGRFHFYRRFSRDWQRLTARETLILFYPVDGTADIDFGEDDEDKFDLESPIQI